MHLADAFIQSDLQLHSGYTFCQYMCSLGIEPTTFCAADAMLYHWATQEHGKHGNLYEQTYVLFTSATLNQSGTGYILSKHILSLNICRGT